MIERHHLIFAAPNSSFTVDPRHKDNQQIVNYVAKWINNKLPCVCTRQLIKNDLKMSVGLPVILDNTKYRVTIFLSKNKLHKQQSLPTLVDMTHFLFKKLNKNFSQESILDFKAISVYGSYLFEYLSNKPFVNQNSDLDLLIEYTQFSLSDLNQILNKLRKMFQIPIDGEVRFNNLGDIALNELINPYAQRFLFKNINDIGLISRNELYEQYPDLHGH